MNEKTKANILLGFFLLSGMTVLGYFIAASPVRFKEFERTVSVKGLSEREVTADVAIWPITYSAAGNEIADLYRTLETDHRRIMSFLVEKGFAEESVTTTEPSVVDKVAQNYGGQPVEVRFAAQQTVTVYTDRVDDVRAAKSRLSDLGKAGVILKGSKYSGATEYLFTRLNDLKPVMIEEATRNAREVALKFARDSESSLGKIRSARQGQFSITDRDRNNPHIKKVRVVSTIDYYLSD